MKVISKDKVIKGACGVDLKGAVKNKGRAR